MRTISHDNHYKKVDDGGDAMKDYKKSHYSDYCDSSHHKITTRVTIASRTKGILIVPLMVSPVITIYSNPLYGDSNLSSRYCRSSYSDLCCFWTSLTLLLRAGRDALLTANAEPAGSFQKLQALDKTLKGRLWLRV